METATTTKTIRENANRVILDLSQFDLILLLFAFFYFATAPAPRDRIGRRMARQRTINLFIIFNQTVTNGRLIFDRKICILFEFQSAPKFIHGIQYVRRAPTETGPRRVQSSRLSFQAMSHHRRR